MIDENARIADDIRNAYEEGYADGKRDAVVHGHWIYCKGSNGKDYRKCSVCLHTQEITGVLNYCSICGAKMDESTQSNDSNTLDAFGKEAGERTWNRFTDDVKSVPAVDAVPVVHGHLIDMGDFEQCSTCKDWREGDRMKTTSIENSIGVIIGEAIKMLLTNKRRSKNIFTHDKQITLVKDGDYSHSIKIILGDGWFSEDREKVKE